MTITKKKSASQERRVARELGGRRIPLSGAGSEKGDGRVAQRYVRTEDGVEETVRLTLRIENKLTSKPSYTLSSQDWDKLYRAAQSCGEHPLFHIELSVSGIGSVQVAVITEQLALELGFSPAVLWDRKPAKSFSVSWERCLQGLPYSLHLHDQHRLVVADYLKVRNAIQEIQ